MLTTIGSWGTLFGGNPCHSGGELKRMLLFFGLDLMGRGVFLMENGNDLDGLGGGGLAGF